jgi:TonB family protein
MKGPSLQKTAVLSAGLHMMFFLLSVLILRQSHDMVMPSPYIVSLVGPAGDTRKADAGSAKSVEPGALPVEKNTSRIDEKKELKSIEESIAALKAKRRTEEKLQQIVRLRSLVSIQGKGGQAVTKSPATGGTSGSALGAGEAGYIDKIAGQIHEQWGWPDYGKKNLEAVISVRIQKDGTLSDVKFEKKSGDRFFDRTVLQAILKASPVSRPPYEMEIGIRFYP